MNKIAKMCDSFVIIIGFLTVIAFIVSIILSIWRFFL